MAGLVTRTASVRFPNICTIYIPLKYFSLVIIYVDGGWCGADVCISEGDNLSLPCDLTYTLWRHNNEEILYIGDGKILFSNVEAAENGTHLIIKNVKPGDAGVRNAIFFY